MSLLPISNNTKITTTSFVENPQNKSGLADKVTDTANSIITSTKSSSSNLYSKISAKNESSKIKEDILLIAHYDELEALLSGAQEFNEDTTRDITENITKTKTIFQFHKPEDSLHIPENKRVPILLGKDKNDNYGIIDSKEFENLRKKYAYEGLLNIRAGNQEIKNVNIIGTFTDQQSLFIQITIRQVLGEIERRQKEQAVRKSQHDQEDRTTEINRQIQNKEHIKPQIKDNVRSETQMIKGHGVDLQQEEINTMRRSHKKRALQEKDQEILDKKEQILSKEINKENIKSDNLKSDNLKSDILKSSENKYRSTEKQ